MVTTWSIGRSAWVSLVIAAAAAAWGGSVAGAGKPSGVVNSVPTLKKVVALTFDDGPTKKWTPEILRVLQANHVKATFFVVGSQALRYPQYLNQEIKAGMEIGSHGAKHVTRRGKSAAVVEHEVRDNQQILESLGTPKPKLYRLPGGNSDVVARGVLERLGYTVIGWSVDPRDWRHRYTADQMTTLVMKHVEPGAIVIFHDGPNSSRATVEAVTQIIPQLKREGYHMVTVGQILKDLPPRVNRLRPSAASEGRAFHHGAAAAYAPLTKF